MDEALGLRGLNVPWTRLSPNRVNPWDRREKGCTQARRDERAGVVKTNDGKIGALTMIGTVSPAGGNFESRSLSPRSPQ